MPGNAAANANLPNKWKTMVAVCLGLGMLMIDNFVVNVAFPTIGRDLDASLSAAEWTVSGYVLVLGILPLAMGRFGDIFGRRRVYIVGLVVFVTASGLCGAATTIEELIAFRLVQGAGAAVMMPGTLSILTNAFPAEQRGLAIGIWGGVSGLGLIAGPILGGALTESGDWRWIFLVNIPVGAAALAMAVRWVGESRDESAPRSVDVPGLVLLACGLGSAMFGLTQANSEGWSSPIIIACFAGGAAALLLFGVVETRRRVPLVDLGLFRSRTFVMACAGSFLFSAAVFGSQPFASLYMQNYLGFSPLEGGLAFLPATFLVALLMPFSGIVGQKLGARIRLIIIAGSLSVALSFVLLMRLDVESGYTDGLLGPFLVRGIGIGLVMSAMSVAVMGAVPMAQSGLAAGTLTMARQVGTAFGLAVMGAVYLHHVHTGLPQRLESVTPTERLAVTRAVEHFTPAGEGPAREAARASIVDGFVLLAGAGLVLSAVTVGSAFLIASRRREAVSPMASAAAACAGGTS